MSQVGVVHLVRVCHVHMRPRVNLTGPVLGGNRFAGDTVIANRHTHTDTNTQGKRDITHCSISPSVISEALMGKDIHRNQFIRLELRKAPPHTKTKDITGNIMY